MNTALIVLGQVFIILILMAVGAAAYKTKMISEKAADDMAAFALKIVTPCVIIQAFQIDFDPHKLFNMLIAAILSILTHIVGIVLAKLFFREDTDGNKVRRFAAIYSNCGFMGIPLIQGAVGNEGVLYACVYLVVFQALMWSHGVMTIKGGFKSIKPYKIFVNAGTIGIAVGLPLFFFSVKLPDVLSQAVGHIANLNTPLAMIVSGVYVAKSDIKKAFTRPKNYLSVSLRQIIVPLIMMAVILAFPINPTVALSILLIAACPVASSVTLFAALYGSARDLECAGRTLTLSNILSLATIPLIALIYAKLLEILG
ncbi:MAG: AEC family transporter [Ruminococcaceae bacterium]|nr:AEC family transporter [Oscillospiraceae bacterium]